ncbi:carboxymethylenebutenolidase [Rhodococcus sp. Leaf7]|uniref:dienelactone hydrolase family protein n=1 Tax=unclassified Rhodococcus (in: high G+C Gram-positive bacteria) TaxID=192944 RepID=UPI0006F2E828|nr:MULTISPECIES: dienelactone hydrolase family protein [unclassified Rhodococcus (in: high G+C Gram-positive bacteria)]KQU06925.1 carboxymethylenebutenolidase [Rhodococcus sp. Leaf7]KQU42444.1 carboxymethylenebutenolidase [Rhodococcus sp. Leaf247]
MTVIQVDTGTDRIDATLATPSGEGPWPAVVIVHDVFGMSDDVRNIAQRFADKGYLALVPDLYARGGRAKCVVGVFRSLFARQGQAVDDLMACRDALVARDDTTDSVAIVGFCMGGGFALALAPRGFDASAPFYGVLPKNIEEALEGACPIVASFGKHDPVLQGAGKKVEKVLQDKGIEHDVKTYPGAGHSFANDSARGPAALLLRITGFGYKHDQSEDAFARVFDFFGRHVKN